MGVAGRARKWIIKAERRAVAAVGGNQNKRRGADGQRRGRPVEVKAQRRDNRHRIGKKAHARMIRENGTYILIGRNGHRDTVPASEVSRAMGPGNWYNDKREGGANYKHRFIIHKEVCKK